MSGQSQNGTKVQYRITQRPLGLFTVALGLLLMASACTDIFWAYKRIPMAIYVAYFSAFLMALFATLIRYGPRDRLIIRDWVYYAILSVLLLNVGVSFLHGPMTQHSLDYLLWFSWVIGMYGLFGKYLADQARPGPKTYLWLELSVFFVCILGLQDWAAQNGYFFSVSLLDQLDRGQTVFRSELLGHIRLRASVEEAGHFALFLNIFVPLTLLRPRRSTVWMILYGCVVVTAYMLTMSLAAFGTVLFSIFLAYFFTLRKTTTSFFKWIMVTSLVVLILSVMMTNMSNQVVDRIRDVGDVSRLQRQEVYLKVINLMTNANLDSWLFGHGLASFIDSTGTNPISWYLLFLHDLGLPSVLMILALAFYVWRRIIHSPCTALQKLLLQVSLLAPLFHYTVTANFWHPWIWLALSLILAYVQMPFGVDARFLRRVQASVPGK